MKRLIFLLKKGILRNAILKLFVFVTFCLIVTSSNCQSWTIFRGNQQLIGFVNSEIPSRPDILWTFKTGDEIKSSPVYESDKIIIGSADGNVYCIDINGKLKWRYKTDNSIEAPALIFNKTVYIGNLNGTFYSINLEKGTLNWKYTTEGQIMGGANWWTDGLKTYILIGSYDYFLHCIDASTGKQIWKYESGNYINGCVAIDKDNAIFGGCDGILHMVNIKTGKGDKMIPIATYVAGSASVENNKAYVGDYDGGFSCVDLKAGKVLWKWNNTDTKQPFIASPSIIGDLVIIGSRDKFLYCFNKISGKLIWKINSGARVDASVLVTKTKILASTMRGDLVASNLKDGKLIWTYELGSAIFSNPLIFNKKIIVCTQDGNVYCLGIH